MRPSPPISQGICLPSSNDAVFRMLKHEYSYIGGRKSGVYANNGNRVVQGGTTEILTGLLPVFANKLGCAGLDFFTITDETAAYDHNRISRKLLLASELLQESGILFLVSSTALYTSLKSTLEALPGHGNMVADFTNYVCNKDKWELQHVLIYYKGNKEESNIASATDCFSGKQFRNMLPADLIGYCMHVACSKEAILLNAISGFDTMAAPVLQLNKLDKGNRNFLLLYPINSTDEYASLQQVLALEADFDCYTPGDALFNRESSGQLNTLLPVKQIRAYIWYTETGVGFMDNCFSPSEPYLLGIHNNTAIYLIYENDTITSLNQEFLQALKTTARQYIVYAHQCDLSSAQLQSKKIRFKQIPQNC